VLWHLAPAVLLGLKWGRGKQERPPD
jgi:hypothetical protein